MKIINYVLICVLFISVNAFAGGKTADKSGKKLSCEEKSKLRKQKHIECIRKHSKRYTNVTLSECDKKQPEEIKKFCEKSVALRNEIGSVMNKQITAIENDNKEEETKLKEQEHKLRGQLKLVDKEKHLSWKMKHFEHYAEKYSDSKQMKTITGKAKQLKEQYLKISKQVIDLQEQERNIEKQFKELDKQVRSIKHAGRDKKCQAKKDKKSKGK